MPRLTPGTRLAGRFVLIGRIGAGGMAQVWRATDEVLGRPVAVKLLDAGIAADPVLREAAWREARAAARLVHPSVTRVYDYGQTRLPGGEQLPYLVMELVEGQSLASRLAAGPLPWRPAAEMGAHVAAALAAAHALGVVHHDVKPGNVMLTADGAKLLDFGTAALVGAIDLDALVGTPGYTAPERLEWGPAQPASDVYSLGVLLHEAVGEQPDLPAELAELVRACRSPDPAGRPPARRVTAVLAGLAGIPDPAAGVAAEPPTMAIPRPGVVGAVARPQPRTRVEERLPGSPAVAPRAGRRLLLAGVAVAAVVLGLVLGLALAQPRSGPETAGPGPAGGSTSPSTPQSTSPSTPPPAGSPMGPRAVVAEFDQRVSDAQLAGLLDRDPARKLQDRLDELVKELEKPNEEADQRAEKVREKAEDLREELDELQEDGEIPLALATELRALLARLGG